MNNDGINAILSAIESRINDVLPISDSSLLMQAMRYSTLNGGKRLRPLLTVAAGHISCATQQDLIDIGVAMEFLHCYSLIHDDLPCMDNDDLRRGKPTCHKQYNEAIAILAGDSLQAQAFAILSNPRLNNISANVRLEIIQLCSINCGVDGLTGGQAIDLMSEGVILSPTQLYNMHMKKTGALIKVAILSGYLAGPIFDEAIFQQLQVIAEKIGLLFQIIDDILDCTKDTQILGKTANKDLVNNKATYVNLLGLAKTRVIAVDLYNEIIVKLQVIPHTDAIINLVNVIYTRSN